MLKTIPITPFPSIPWLSVSNPTGGAGTTSGIDAAGEKWALIFRAPKTGTIDRIRFTTGAVSSSQDLSVSLQTVSATDGFPTGTNYGGSAAETVASPAANTIYTVTFATPASATKGDVIAVVIEWAGTAGNVLFFRPASGLIQNNLCYSALYTSSWVKSSTGVTPPFFSVIYDDNTTEFIGCPPAMSYTTTLIMQINNASTPDEIGLRFKMPFGARAAGIQGWINMPATREASFILYSDAGTALGTISPDFNQTQELSTMFTAFFTTPVTLQKDTWYRLMYRPDTSGTVLSIPHFEFTDAIDLGQFNGADVYHCERTNAGAFTDVTSEYTPISLLIDAIDIPGVYMVNE